MAERFQVGWMREFIYPPQDLRRNVVAGLGSLTVSRSHHRVRTVLGIPPCFDDPHSNRHHIIM